MSVTQDLPVAAPELSPALRERAAATASLIARRLADPAVVDAAVRAAEGAATYPFGFGGASLYSGYAGSSLLFRYASRVPGETADEWHGHAHQQLMDAVASTHDVPLFEIGLSTGTAGLALVVDDAARSDHRYTNAAVAMRHRMADQVVTAADWRTTDGLRDGDYDVIIGSAGALAYLAGVEEPDERVEAAAARLIDDLVWMCTPDPATGRRPWWIAPRHYPSEEYHEKYPHGYVNLGLSHGIPGVLAALAMAWNAGLRRPGLDEAIRSCADHVVGATVEADGAAAWPMGIPLDEAGDEVRHGLHRARFAWCYGTPGVAVALRHAADALADPAVRAVADDAFDAVLRLFSRSGGFGSATLCHGTAGILAICAVSDTPLARQTLPALTEHLLSHCDPALPLGVQDLEKPGVLLDSPGLLTGAAGVALALWLVAVPDLDRRWLRTLLVT